MVNGRQAAVMAPLQLDAPIQTKLLLHDFVRTEAPTAAHPLQACT